jgi:hypothetical protein
MLRLLPRAGCRHGADTRLSVNGPEQQPLPLQCVLGEPSGPGQGGLGPGACWHDPDRVEPELLLPVSDLVDVGWCSDHEFEDWGQGPHLGASGETVDLTLQHTNRDVLIHGPEITIRPVGTRRVAGRSR